MTPAGFPHSDIPGSKTVCVSPRLIAAYHVLHRLLVPRHPPCALSSLTGIYAPKVLLAFAQRLNIRLSKIERDAPASRAHMRTDIHMRAKIYISHANSVHATVSRIWWR
jgi:hypothetical protein